MTERAQVTRIMVTSDCPPQEPRPVIRPTTDVDAAQLGDGAFIAYVMIRMFKFGISLFTKRWPNLA